MWIERLTLKDFRCFYGEHSLTFSTDESRNVTLIHAENGVGKTTLLNALLWCFYGKLTEKFERRDDLVNLDAREAGRTSAFVEVLFSHNNNRYRARRHTKGGAGDREFVVMRLDAGSNVPVSNPDMFINSVIPEDMAGHFLFDGEHAEVFLGEENRAGIREAVQDILGCSLVRTAIQDLTETATHFRRQAPTSRATAGLEETNRRIDALVEQAAEAEKARDALDADVQHVEQRIADIEAQLRNSTAAKQLQAQRDKATAQLESARRRKREANDAVLKWFSEDGRYLVSTRLSELALESLDQKEMKGRLPAPYNEELVHDLLEAHRCICQRELTVGTPPYEAVQSLLQKAANATLRDRIKKVQTVLNQFKRERPKAPGRLEDANRRVLQADSDIATLERDIEDVSIKLRGIDFDDIAEREKRRNELRREANLKRESIGSFNHRIDQAGREIESLKRELEQLARNDKEARTFLVRSNFCERLKGRLERELKEDERAARGVLRTSIERILAKTSRKHFRLRLSEDYSVSLVNEAGTPLAKSGGENQLLGLAFTAALVEFAKLRQNAEGHKLLRGTIAPLVLDSPFGQLDEDYRGTTASYVPQMAGQVVMLLSRSQCSPPVMDALKDRVGEEYVIVRHNKDKRESRPPETRQFHGRTIETARFGADFDGSTLEQVTQL